MAALALPLLLGGLPSIISGITGLFKGRGGSMRRVSAAMKMKKLRGGALSVMGKWPVIDRPARYRQGGSLAVMGKWPLIERPAHYRHGGSMAARMIEQALPLIPLRGRRPAMAPPLRVPGYARVGGRARRTGGFNVGSLLSGLTTGANLIGQLGQAFGFGGGKRRAAAHAHARAHKVGGKINLQNILKGVAVGARALGDVGKAFGYGGYSGGASAKHLVRAHVSHSPSGKPIVVRGHFARGGMNLAAFPNVSPAVVKALTMGARALLPGAGSGGRLRMPAKMVAYPMVAPHKVRPHVRLAPTGLQKVHGHLKGMGGLLNPAGAGRRLAVLRTARAR